MPIENAISEGRQLRLLLMAFLFFANYAKFLSNSFLFGSNGNIAVSVFIVISQGFLVHAGCKVVGSQGAGNVVPYAEDSPRDCRSCTEVEHGKGSSKAAVLHANLNGNSLGLGNIHLQKLADGKAAGIKSQPPIGRLALVTCTDFRRKDLLLEGSRRSCGP